MKSFGKSFDSETIADNYRGREIYKRIDKHFSGIYYQRDTEKVFSNDSFKRLYRRRDRDLEDPSSARFKYSPLEHIEEAMSKDHSRFLMLFIDSEITRFLLMERLPHYERLVQQASDSGNRRALVVLEGSRLEHDKENQKYYLKVLSQLKRHISDGDFVVFSELDNIYGILYDLFNQRSSMEDSSTSFCQVNYGDMKDRVNVHSKFGCILLKSEADFHDEVGIERRLRRRCSTASKNTF